MQIGLTDVINTFSFIKLATIDDCSRWISWPVATIPGSVFICTGGDLGDISSNSRCEPGVGGRSGRFRSAWCMSDLKIDIKLIKLIKSCPRVAQECPELPKLALQRVTKTFPNLLHHYLATFASFKKKWVTDRPTDRRNDGRTHPHIEMRGCIEKNMTDGQTDRPVCFYL